MKKVSGFRQLLKRVHNDERGSVSLETILIIGAIAIPILFFLLKYGWPRIRAMFGDSMTDLEGARDDVVNPENDGN